MSKNPGKEERSHWAFAYGTDREYLDWLSYQPSAVDGSFNQWKDGVGRNIACHVRQVARGAGTGTKPPFSAIPMRHEQHLNEEQYPIETRVRWADEHLERWVESRKQGGNDRIRQELGL